MTQPAKSQEPSMEEILASIRRIIADDDASKSPPQAAEAPMPVAPAPSPVAAARAATPELRVAEFEPRPPRSPPAPPVVNNAAPADPSSDILDLTESMASPPPAEPAASSVPAGAPHFRTIDGDSDVGFDEASERTFSPPPPEHRDYHETPRSQLISHETSIAVDSAFNALAQTVLVQNARTLEDLVREMLRPMLKSWLDENLPSVVERMVRAEIERVSRGRMG